MRILAASLLLSALVATPALAQSGPVEKAPLTGLKVGGSVGYDRLQADGDGKSGVAYGGLVGYDAQVGSIVLGGEGEVMFASTKECDSGVCVEAGRDLYAGGRIGALISPTSMVYFKAGYTNLRAKLTVGNNTIDKADLDGGRAGVGFESVIGRNGFIGVEYRYSNYESDLSRHQAVVSAGFRF